MNSYHYGRREHHEHQENDHFGMMLLVGVILAGIVLFIETAFHLRLRQLLEAGLYVIYLGGAALLSLQYIWTFKKKRRETWPQAPVHIPLLKDREKVREAYARNSVIPGYTVENQRWYWPDDLRRMQALLVGMSGSGKTSLLLSIIAQDMQRLVRGNHHVPIIIVDGKADWKMRQAVQYLALAAGRSHQFRLLDPTQPEISVRWNPLVMTAHKYHEHVNFIFESFGLRRDFFKGHQHTYFGDLVRVLYYTGKRFNIYDVLVALKDQQVLEEQIEIARERMTRLYSPHDERQLNFDMSAHNLIQSFQSRERVEKIQGLLNELMTFVQDELSVVTGPYEDLISLEDVIDQELILYISLNVSLNTRAVTALGRMLLHNLQTLAGKRYQTGNENPPFVSVIMDEFSPLAYPEFGHIIHTARGSNIAILFSLQTVAELADQVSFAFCKSVITAPNTVMALRCRNDQETVKYFTTSSSLVEAKRRTMTIEETGILNKKTREIGFGSETIIQETRAKDEQLRNLPIGQFQVLATHDILGTEFLHLHARREPEFKLDCFKPMIFPRTRIPNFFTDGLNLRLPDPRTTDRRIRIKGRSYPLG
jgi:hypothetical protein